MPSLQLHLTLIYAHFCRIPQLNLRLKTMNIKLHDLLQICKELSTTTSKLSNLFFRLIKTKFISKLDKPLGYDPLYILIINGFII